MSNISEVITIVINALFFMIAVIFLVLYINAAHKQNIIALKSVQDKKIIYESGAEANEISSTIISCSDVYYEIQSLDKDVNVVIDGKTLDMEQNSTKMLMQYIRIFQNYKRIYKFNESGKIVEIQYIST